MSPEKCLWNNKGEITGDLDKSRFGRVVEIKGRAEWVKR